MNLFRKWVLILCLFTSAGALHAPAEARSRSKQVVQNRTASPAEQDYQAARKQYYQLINSGQTGDVSQWEVCIAMFRKVYEQYPDHPKAADSLFTTGLLNWNIHQRFGRREALYKAIEAYENTASRYSEDSLADHALYNIAVIYEENIGDSTQAAKYLSRLITDYPKGEMASQGRALLKKNQERSNVRKESSVKRNKIDSSYLNAWRDEEKRATPTPVTDTPAIDKNLIRDIRFWTNPDFTRVSIYLSTATEFKHHLLKKDPFLKKPWRLFVDLNSTKLSPNLQKTIEVKDSLLKQVRAGQFSNDTSRVVLDMNAVYDYEVKALTDPPRVIIDVQGNAPKPTTVQSQPAPPTVASPSGQPTPVIPDPAVALRTPVEIKPEPLKPENTLRQQGGFSDEGAAKRDSESKVVYIDPGHGGDDPGARGPSGIEEKEVVLEIALKLAALLSENKKYKVILTRDKDIFIPLPERTKMANDGKGDLFVSIHANASEKRVASGISTYIFDNATDDYSRKLEDIENASIVQGQKEQPDFLTMMFKSMTKNYFTNQSVELASEVQKGMTGILKQRYRDIRDLGIRQAQFYVLWNTEMPAVLVETSFISNRTEESRLTSDYYQNEIARGIAKGINRFFAVHSDRGVAAR